MRSPEIVAALGRAASPRPTGSARAAAAHIVEVAKTAVRYLADHTGLPAIFVAAVLVTVGYRLLRRTFRWGVEIALVATALTVAWKLGWITW